MKLLDCRRTSLPIEYNSISIVTAAVCLEYGVLCTRPPGVQLASRLHLEKKLLLSAKECIDDHICDQLRGVCG